MTDNGRTLVKLRDYQRDYIHLVADEVYNEDLNEFVPKIAISAVCKADNPLSVSL